MTPPHPHVHPSRIPHSPLAVLDESSRLQVRAMLDQYLVEGRHLMTPEARATLADPADLSYPAFDDGADPSFEAYAIRADSHWLTGFVFLREWPDSLEIQELYVAPTWRHRRLATQAVDEVKAMGRRQRVNRIIARVFRTNAPAIAFWVANHFWYVSSDPRLGLDTYTWPHGLMASASRGYW